MHNPLQTYLLCQSDGFLCILQDAIEPRDGVDLCTQGGSLALQLVSHDVDGMSPGSDERDTVLLQPPSKLLVLREKPIARMYLEDDKGRLREKGCEKNGDCYQLR